MRRRKSVEAVAALPERLRCPVIFDYLTRALIAEGAASGMTEPISAHAFARWRAAVDEWLTAQRLPEPVCAELRSVRPQWCYRDGYPVRRLRPWRPVS